MRQFTSGLYFGKNTFQRKIDGLILSQNDYSADAASDWHYHENPYIDFILKGGGVEIRKEREVECVPGNLTFCNTEEKHKNVKYVDGSKFFFIECERSWFAKMDMTEKDFEGNFVIENQRVKDILPQIIFESKNEDSETELAIESLAVNLFSYFSKQKTEYRTAPKWLLVLKDLLHSAPCHLYSLSELATRFGVHPVTISKLFPRFFWNDDRQLHQRYQTRKIIGTAFKKTYSAGNDCLAMRIRRSHALLPNLQKTKRSYAFGVPRIYLWLKTFKRFLA